MLSALAVCCSASNTPRGRPHRTAVPGPLGRVPAKLRQSDARWRASLQACYTLLRPVLQSRHPHLSRTSKTRTLEATRQHILELERALSMLLEMKNNVIQTLFDDSPPPRLSIEQYKTLFRSLYPLDAPVAEQSTYDYVRSAQPLDGPTGDGPSAAASGPSGSSSSTSDTSPAGGTMPGQPTEPDLAELASLLHDAYDATDGQMTEVMPALSLAGGDGNMVAPIPLMEVAMLGPGVFGIGGGDAGPAVLVGAENDLEGTEGEAKMSGRTAETPERDEETFGKHEKTPAEGAETAEGDVGEVGGNAEFLPDVEENLSLELPSLELSVGWGDCGVEPPSGRPAAWQELEMAAQSLSVPAELAQFTKIQRADWDLDGAMTADPALPESHLSPLSPEMALPAFCSTPDGAEGRPILATPPPGSGRAKRAGSAAAAAGRRAADRCRRALTLGGGR